MRGDGYTELPNEATAVDFVQPLCRMRQWSCNRLPINNALVSGARARAREEVGEEVEKKKNGRRRVEARSGRMGGRWRRREEGGGEMSANVVDRASCVRARRRRGGISSLPVRYTNRVYAAPDRCAMNGG